jgi:hypothetical protein
MEFAKRVIAAVVTAAIIGGCASTGGGGGGAVTATYTDGSTRELTLQEFIGCLYTLLLFCGPEAGQSQGGGGQAQVPPFTSWSAVRHQQERVRLSGPEVQVAYSSAAEGTLDEVSAPAFAGSGSVIVYYDLKDQFGTFDRGSVFNGWLYSGQYGAPRYPGQPGIDVPKNFLNPGNEPTPFADLNTMDVGVIANPYALGWNYQSFGAWNDHATGIANGIMGATSYGAATPAQSVPAGGTATFSGKVGGLYASPEGLGSMAVAELSVGVNFSARSLSIASSSTTLSRDLRAATAAPQLDLSGTLRYAPGSSSFSGTLVNAGGTMSGTSSGRFYGPAAEELGGVFTLRSAAGPETFVGAYGAKR